MSHLHDDGELDVDAPIPYTLTMAGRRTIAAYDLELAEMQCHHDWQVDLSVGLVCSRCGAEQSPRRPLIPGYLSPRERFGK